jgi:deazaflavin-dependent oxidoreductase (nitroreductase family)
VLAWFPDDASSDSGLIVGSNGGSARHPGWAFNLVKHPDRAAIDLGQGPVPITVELLAGAQREAGWKRVVDRARLYQRYATKTDREIPLFRLSVDNP